MKSRSAKRWRAGPSTCSRWPRARPTSSRCALSPKTTSAQRFFHPLGALRQRTEKAESAADEAARVSFKKSARASAITLAICDDRWIIDGPVNSVRQTETEGESERAPSDPPPGARDRNRPRVEARPMRLFLAHFPVSRNRQCCALHSTAQQ